MTSFNPKKFFEEIVETEKQFLQKDGQTFMKIIAVSSTDERTLFGLPDYDPQYKESLFSQLGTKLKKIVPDLEALVLLSDTFFVQIDKKKEYSPKERLAISMFLSGGLRLADLPEDLSHLRGESLALMSHDRDGNLFHTNIPYIRENGKIRFKRSFSINKSQDIKDNMLSLVWKAYQIA